MPLGLLPDVCGSAFVFNIAWIALRMASRFMSVLVCAVASGIGASRESCGVVSEVPMSTNAAA